MRPNAALNCTARSVCFSPSEARLNAAQTCRASGEFDGYRVRSLSSIGAVLASKFSSTANRINASRTLSRGTPVDLAYAARILRIARLESEGFERQARKRWNLSQTASTLKFCGAARSICAQIPSAASKTPQKSPRGFKISALLAKFKLRCEILKPSAP